MKQDNLDLRYRMKEKLLIISYEVLLLKLRILNYLTYELVQDVLFYIV